MTIWLLALVLMASLAGVGYRQGAIRVAVSSLGILMGFLVAGPLGKLVKPALLAVGVNNPTLVWVLGPPIVFVLVSIVFKVAALAVHQKVDVHYKYHAGDLRLALWERLNRRLGLCVGLLNGAAYTILIAFVVYPLSYWTVQLVAGDSDLRLVRIVNQMGRDLQVTGFAKVARAVDPMPQVWYDTADLVGLIYQNSLLEARLQRYPAFLGLAERPEFQDLSNDKGFIEMRQRQDPVMSVLRYPKVQVIVQNPDLLKTIWTTLVLDLSDLRVFLQTGKSPKYDPERILGHWRFSVNAAMGMMLRAKPNISSTEMKKMKQYMIAAFSKTSFLAMTDHQAVFKNAAAARLPGVSGGQQTLQCQWKNLDGKYQLTISGSELPASVQGDHLTVGAEATGLIFDRED